MIQRLTSSLRRQKRGARAPHTSAPGLDWSISGGGFGPANWTIGRVHPRIEVREAGDRLHVEMELANVRPADVHLSVEGRTLTIHGERWPVNTPENEGTEERDLPYEVRFGQFHRTVHLPFEVNGEAVSESISNDALEIVFERKRTPLK